MAKFQNDVSIYNDYYDAEIEKLAREDLFSEYGEEEGWESPEDVPDERVSDYINHNNDVAADDLDYEMDKFFKEYEKFVISGEVGLWNGRHSGADVIVNKNDLWKYFKDCENFNFYEDENGDLCIECSHHDGNNFFVVRPISDRGYEELERMDVDLDYDGLDLGDDRITGWLDDPANFEHGYFHKLYGFTESHKPSGKTLKEEAGMKKEVFTYETFEIGEDGEENFDNSYESKLFYDFDEAVEAAKKEVAEQTEPTGAFVFAGEYEKENGDVLGDPVAVLSISNTREYKADEYVGGSVRKSRRFRSR